MKNIIQFIIIALFFWIHYTFATINLTVSPIKYEIEVDPWESITRTATLNNRWNNDLQITTWKSDFVANWTTWNPSFVRYSELVHNDQHLSSWISLSSSWFLINANSKKEINFTINVPDHATPGWHYWAVFFKNKNSENSSGSWSAVWINVDYWIIILLKVKWEIITDINVNPDDIQIIDNNWSNSNSNSNNQVWNWWYSKINKVSYNLSWNWNNNLAKKDNCFVDFTNSNYDGKCFEKNSDIIKVALWEEKNIDNTKLVKNNEDNKKNKDNLLENNNKEKNQLNKSDIVKNNEANNQNQNKKDDKNNFNITFKIPVVNKWNTHVKTVWEIKLFDEDWNQIKQIWKKVVINNKWAIIWEKIVDYVPVNDNRWNVLPWTKRIFEPEWKWFPYKKYSQELWKEVIEYKSPWEYYSDLSEGQNLRVMPWERICYDKQTKKIKAKFDIAYINEEWKEVSLPSAKEFNITYTRKYIWYNYYFILWIIFILLSLLVFIWFILLLSKKKCINEDCARRIKRKTKVCPYCWTNQKDKRYKKNKDNKINKIKKDKNSKKVTKKSTIKKNKKTIKK